MKRRSGFTLMELLLVIAILAIVAAVAAPQFFRAGEQAMTDARVALLKANYSAIKAAINMRVWDEKNNPKLVKLLSAQSDFSVLTPGSKIGLLIEKGYLQQNSAYAENKEGKKLYLYIRPARGVSSSTTPDDPYDQVASTPIFMEKVNNYEVCVADHTGTFANLLGIGTIDACLAAGKTWTEIYNAAKDVIGK